MTNKYLEPLLSQRERSTPSVLSVYLNVDESDPANLNRGFERPLKAALASIRKGIEDSAERERFNTAATHVLDFVAAYEVHEKTLAMFYDAMDGFFWHDAFSVGIPTRVHWNTELFLRPLAGVLDEFEKYGIVLLDRANMRMFTMFMGRIEEVAHLKFNRRGVHHLKSVGLDQAWSANHAQQKADEHVRANLRRGVKRLDSQVRSERFGRLILAGAPEVTGEFFNLLPKRLALMVAGSMATAFDASPEDILRHALPVAEQFEREGEAVTVEEMTTAAAKGERAVIGLQNTLHAINHFRVWQLVYSAGLSMPGFECRTCHALTTAGRSVCRYCGGELSETPEIIERAVDHALRQRARIEVVRGPAAAALNAAGGVGAFLRTRTESIRA
jgi:peptide chain release factor subunit 1